MNYDDRVRDVKPFELHFHVCAFESFKILFNYLLKIFYFIVKQLIVAAIFILEVAAHDCNKQATFD